MRHTTSRGALRGLDTHDALAMRQTCGPQGSALGGRVVGYVACLVTLWRGRFSPIRVDPPSLVNV